MRHMGLMLVVMALGVTSQAFAPPLHTTTELGPSVDMKSGWLNAPVATAGSGPLCPPDASGDCCEATPGSGGCDDPECCELVCIRFNPLCCQDVPLGWVQQCADAAAILCDCGPGACPPAAAGTSLGDTEVTVIGEWDGFGGSYADVWGDGDFAYLGHFGDSTISIVDISNPANPIGNVYVLPPPNTSASAQDVKVGDDLLFIGLEGGGRSVHIVDVRDPANPVGLVDIEISGFTTVHNLFYDGGFLYLADSTTRVAIIDLTGFDPDNPPVSPITETKWIIEGVGSWFVHDITVVDGRLYVSAWDSGLWIYDASNVANEIPSFLGSAAGDNTHAAWPTANGDYVVTAEERTDGGIKVYRITELENSGSLELTLTDCFDSPQTPAFSVHNPLIVGYRVYNSWYEAGLLIFDIDPITGQLTEVVTYGRAGSVWGVYPFLGSDRVLLSERNDGLLIVSVGTVPTCPWDCGGDNDNDVGIIDFLALLAQWTEVGTSCDFSGGGVSIVDFLKLLANWGFCP